MSGNVMLPAMRRPAPTVRLFRKDTLVDGSPAQIECVEIGGQCFSLSKGPIRIARLEDEWYEDLADPIPVIEALKENREANADLLTFWQRLPDVVPRYNFHMEPEDLAVLAVTSYDHWWKRQINSKVRSLIRKSEREGVVVRVTAFDDEFVRGMTAIFNETPVRQGRRFWHYGKDFATVKEQFSRHVHRETMIGAYFEGRMIGFVMLCDAGRFALTGQIISNIKDRDKSPNNALIASAVAVCAQRGLPYLSYYYWGEGTLTDFKRHCGFERVTVPRYYVPLSRKGHLALRCGAHRGWRALIPQRVRDQMKRVRAAWYESRHG
jgi:hypothetical protein